MNNDMTYRQWLEQIKNMGGGWLGFLVITITLIFTILGASFGFSLFPDGTYPQIVLMLPGLMAGAGAFFVSSGLLWTVKKSFK
jgi:hypothetical protein